MIQIARPFFRNKELILKAVDAVLETGRLMDGEMTDAFESEFGRYIGSKHAISLNSCTTALEIALRYIGVKDREVIVPTNTFISSCNAVLFAGGIPVLADIKENSYNIGTDEIERKITKKTKAVIGVHIAGIICEEIFEIQQICKNYGLYFIEDCAHAVGATLNGKKAGSFGFASCFSFYPTKIMTTGTGGMITTDSDELDEFARSVRCHGREKTVASEIVNLGNDWFMDEIRAAVGFYQLLDLEEMISRRRMIALNYTERLKNIKRMRILPIPGSCNPTYYKFPILLDKDIDSASFKKLFFQKYGVELESLYWPTCHLQPVYRSLFGYKEGDFPVAESILKQQITLPIHPLIEDKDINYVVSKLEKELCD